MLQMISDFVQLKCQGFVRFAVSILFALSLGCSPAPMFTQEPGHRAFASAEDASRALFDAMQAQDEQAPLSILGAAGKDVLSSGDPQEDLDSRVSFVVKYQQMHRFVFDDFFYTRRQPPLSTAGPEDILSGCSEDAQWSL